MTIVPRPTREAMFSPNANDGVAAIFTIDRPGWDDPYRFLSFEGDLLDFETLRSGIIHEGDEYTYAVVSYARPDDVPGSAATVPLVLENVEQDLSPLLAGSVNDLVVTLKHISISDPDSIVEVFPDFSVLSRTGDFDSSTVSLSLTTDPIENEPANMLKFTPDQFPGHFP